jgi:predicted DNA-binding transcriptional regulator AlpA
MNETREMLKPGEAAAMLRVHVNTLAEWRRRGQGPPAITVGRTVRYPLAAVRAWIARQVEYHTAAFEAAAAALAQPQPLVRLAHDQGSVHVSRVRSSGQADQPPLVLPERLPPAFRRLLGVREK